MSSANGSKWLAGFKADYNKIFVEEWSPYLGGILLMLVVIGLMINGLFWGVFGGVKFWGDWFNNLIGLGPMLAVLAALGGAALLGAASFGLYRWAGKWGFRKAREQLEGMLNAVEAAARSQALFGATPEPSRPPRGGGANGGDCQRSSGPGGNSGSMRSCSRSSGRRSTARS